MFENASPVANDQISAMINSLLKNRESRHSHMKIKIKLSEQEQHWLEQIAAHEGVSTSAAIKSMIREKHEIIAMDLAFEQYPDGKSAPKNEADDDNRSSRKAALKRSLIERARQKTIDDSSTEP
jgi:hypothetical protein